MANTKISQLPSWSGTAADLRWFVMNNSGENETFKFSGYTSQYIPGTGSYSLRHYTNTASNASATYATVFGDPTNRASGNYGFVGGGYNNNVDSLYGGVVGGQQLTAGFRCFAAGGYNNLANGNGAAVIGGENNSCNNISSGGIFASSQSKQYGGNDIGYFIGGGGLNITSANGARGIFSIGGYSNRIQNFRGPSDAARFNYGGILGGYNNYIGWDRTAPDNSTAGQNAYTLILGGYNNTIISLQDGAGDPNYFTNIMNSDSCNISGATTGGTIINSVNTTISGRTRVTMIGTSGRTADADNTTYVENAHAFRTYSTSVQAVSSGSTFTCNLNNGGKAQFYLTANTTIDITNVRDGQSFIIKTQTNGNYTITWTATGYTFVFEGGIKDPGNTTTDLFVFEVFGSVIYGSRRHNYS